MALTEAFLSITIYRGTIPLRRESVSMKRYQQTASASLRKAPGMTTMKSTGRQIIHFVNNICDSNVGDIHCCPLYYYYSFFKDYNLMRHHFDHVDWGQIGKRDIVVIGGGGMLSAYPSINATINRLLSACDTVIVWGAGENSLYDIWPYGATLGLEFPEIDFSRFAMIGVRDYNHPLGLEYLPCSTALVPELRRSGKIKRRIGVIEHLLMPINGLPYDKISNASSMDEVTDFIATSDTIVTNSYHMTYLLT